MIPMANSDPDTGVQLTTGVESTLSTAVGSAQVTTTVERPGSVCCVRSFGQEEISGASLSETKMNTDEIEEKLKNQI